MARKRHLTARSSVSSAVLPRNSAASAGRRRRLNLKYLIAGVGDVLNSRRVRCSFSELLVQSFGLGGGSSRATTGSQKPVRLWLPSQNGLLADWPQRHSEITV